MTKFKWIVLTTVISFVVAVGWSVPTMASSTKAMAEMKRINPDDVMKKVKAGEALLVCSYGDKKCKTILLEGALLRSEFESKITTLPRTQEIIFYCS